MSAFVLKLIKPICSFLSYHQHAASPTHSWEWAASVSARSRPMAISSGVAGTLGMRSMMGEVTMLQTMVSPCGLIVGGWV